MKNVNDYFAIKYPNTEANEAEQQKHDDDRATYLKDLKQKADGGDIAARRLLRHESINDKLASVGPVDANGYPVKKS